MDTAKASLVLLKIVNAVTIKVQQRVIRVIWIETMSEFPIIRYAVMIAVAGQDEKRLGSVVIEKDRIRKVCRDYLRVIGCVDPPVRRA